MAKPTGGRGVKAPYETTHIRIPVPLKEQIEVEIDKYKEAISKSNNLLTGYSICSDNNLLTSLEDAKKVAVSALKQKKSASQSLARLLSEIYQVEVTVEELKSLSV